MEEEMDEMLELQPENSPIPISLRSKVNEAKEQLKEEFQRTFTARNPDGSLEISRALKPEYWKLLSQM